MEKSKVEINIHNQTYTILSTAENVVGSFLVEVARLEPSEERSSAHGCLDDPVRDLNVADLPRGE